MARLWDVGKTEPIKVGKASPTDGTLPTSAYLDFLRLTIVAATIMYMQWWSIACFSGLAPIVNSPWCRYRMSFHLQSRSFHVCCNQFSYEFSLDLSRISASIQ